VIGCDPEVQPMRFVVLAMFGLAMLASDCDCDCGGKKSAVPIVRVGWLTRDAGSAPQHR